MTDRSILRSNLFNYLKCLHTEMKRRQKTRHHKCCMSVEDLETKWYQQKGKCALSSVPMTHTYDTNIKTRKETNASVDRKNPNGDYTPANTQLVCTRVNLMKNRLREPLFTYMCARVYETYKAKTQEMAKNTQDKKKQ